MTQPSAGERFRAALAEERPLQIVGAVNAYCALLAERAGFRALYLSGAGVANASYGLPDLGMTTASDVAVDIRRLTAVTSLPLLVDADTGWGHALNIARTVREFEAAGAAGLHIEDQQAAKRCGHRPGKALVEPEEMEDRIRAATAAKSDPAFVIMARTDALAAEGIDGAMARCRRYVVAGADMIFAEAVADPADYRRFVSAVGVPVLANLTEFGRTPLLGRDELAVLGVAMSLYPLSAFRAMNAAAESVYRAIRTEGSQRSVLDRMQTRDQLYEVLRYAAYEKQMDDLIRKEKA